MDDTHSLASEMLQTELEFDDVAVAPALTDANLTDAIENCLDEAPVDGLCSRYGLITTKFGTSSSNACQIQINAWQVAALGLFEPGDEFVF